MRDLRRAWLVLAILLFSLTAAAGRAETVLDEEFWAELQPLVVQGERTVTMETAIKLVLEEARYVFSGMVYGFDFSYTPQDLGRKVEEEFVLKAVDEILRGDPNLGVQQTRMEGSRVFVRLRYALRDFQEDRYRSMRSNVLASNAGTGEASYFKGPAEKIAAIEQAAKNAVREYARTRIPNKPRKITGSLVLAAAPRIVIVSGVYRASCVVKLRIDETTPYRAF